VQQLEELSGGVLVQNFGELVQSRGNLETLVKDLLLTLKTNVVGPLDEARDITLGLNILTYFFFLVRFSAILSQSISFTNAKVLGGLFNQRVGGGLGSLLSLDGIGSRSNLLTGGLLGGSLHKSSCLVFFESIQSYIHSSIPIPSHPSLL
jgi:hypothetical protein